MLPKPHLISRTDISGRAWRGSLVGLFILTCLGLVLVPGILPSFREAPPKPQPESEQSATRPGPVAGTKNSPVASSPRGEGTAVRRARQPQEVLEKKPTPAVLQLIESLTTLEAPGGVLTEREAATWKQNLRRLVNEGAEAVPGIREMLLEHQDQDLDFTAIPGWELLGQPTLRTALLQALVEIGGQEAQELLAETLRTTAIPSEVAMIARALELQAPGQYRQDTLNAASEVFSMASKGQLVGWDVGPLFQLLRDYPGGETVQMLEQARSQWKYYATITLAGLPEGEGVDALIRQAQAVVPGDGGQGELGLQMLAQIAAQNPEAAAALAEQAALGKIPDSAWPKIASGLSGDQYGMIGSVNGVRADAPNVLGTKVYYIAQGNQKFFSVPLWALDPTAQLDQRRALIDQLLNTAPNPAAVRVLQSAKDRLTTLLAGK